MARFIFNAKSRNKSLDYLKFLRGEIAKVRGKAEASITLKPGQTLAEAYAEEIARLVCHERWYNFDYIILDYDNYDLQLINATSPFVKDVLSRIPEKGLELIGASGDEN